ncbi:MAG TPA: energy-coupling factor ABC transporter permease [Candidatus Gastranaerophilales bacterium]|nr:energy-coupling factor ABC transporter permease [Candidatus Gastranaerophilales bacterium]
MSHLHIPDGIISIWLWVLGYLVTGFYLFFFYKHLKKSKQHKKIAVVNVFTALMLLSMSIPIPFILPYHINLSALSGIILGPFYAGPAIFIVNIILAFVGHGGITMVGLNTFVLTIEALIAFLLFKALKKKFHNIFNAAFASTFIALVISTFLTIGIVYAGTQNLEFVTEHHHHEGEHNDHDHAEKAHEHLENDHQDHAEEPLASTNQEKFDIKRFLMLILLTGSLGWTLESFLTGFIVNYLSKVKPDLLENQGN